MKKVYIVSARRTAIGTFDGSLKDTPAAELATVAARDAIAAAGLEPRDIQETIFGNVLSAGVGQNVARQAALAAGVPQEIPAFTVNKLCGSGLKSVQLAAQAIRAGDSRIVLAGGTENMNRAPYLLHGARFGLRMGDPQLVDSLVSEGLWCSIENCHMGITAENLADRYDISREQMDAFALESHRRAVAATREGRFRDEITPVPVKKKKDTVPFDTDEHPREDTSLEKLADLRAAFRKDGRVTAGNASGINDAAAALVLAGEETVKARKLGPAAELVACASAGVHPAYMGIGPVAAIRKLLEKTGLSLADVELFEVNEAFAVQMLAVDKELKLGTERVNVNGGAVALGHPIGASGARILVTLLHAMKQRGAKTGVAALCIGGGMGIAALVRMAE